MRPDSTRVWTLGEEFRKTVPDVVTMPQHFHRFGYRTVSLGKIFHNHMPDRISWDEPDLRPAEYATPELIDRDPESFYYDEELKKELAAVREKRIAENPARYAGGWAYGRSTECSDAPDNAFYDGAQTDLALATLRRIKDGRQPFFMALGYYRPHLPFVAPKRYWDLYDPRRPWRNSYSEAFYGKGHDEDFATLPGAGRMLRTMLIWRELGVEPERMEQVLTASLRSNDLTVIVVRRCCLLAAGKITRFGFITTNSLTQPLHGRVHERVGGEVLADLVDRHLVPDEGPGVGRVDPVEAGVGGRGRTDPEVDLLGAGAGVLLVGFLTGYSIKRQRRWSSLS